jgi:hypothetical protein
VASLTDQARIGFHAAASSRHIATGRLPPFAAANYGVLNALYALYERRSAHS